MKLISIHGPVTRWLALAALAAALVGCSSGTSATPIPEGALMAIQTRGGMCIEGSCESTIYLERDGLVHQAAKQPNELGIVPADAVAELEQQIAATEFDEVRSHPFTGTCPTAFDGQELVFEFATADGVERLESCQVEIDYSSPLFSAVTNAVGQFVPLGSIDPGVPFPERPPVNPN